MRSTGSIIGSHVLLPALTLISLGAIGAAALVPVRAPDPEALAEPVSAITMKQRDIDLPEPTETHDWSSLQGTLSELRDPVQVEPPEPDEPDGEEEPAQDAIIKPPPIGVSTTNWKYVGTIEEDEKPIAALILFQSGERFVRAGQEVVDPGTDGGRPVLVKEITPAEIVIERNGREETIPYTPGAGPAGASGAFDRSSPSGAGRRGARPGVRPALPDRSNPDDT